jgi:hypothetical protein
MVIVTTCCGGLTHMSRRLRASQAVICLNVAARASLGRARSQAQRVVPSPQGRAPRPSRTLRSAIRREHVSSGMETEPSDTFRKYPRRPGAWRRNSPDLHQRLAMGLYARADR